MEWNVLAKLNHAPAEDVRYRRNSGKHLFILSFSHFDPMRTRLSFHRYEKLYWLRVIRLSGRRRELSPLLPVVSTNRIASGSDIVTAASCGIPA